MRYAEVIGDPIAQSKSPMIHKYWLERLMLAGDYRRTLVQKETLGDYIHRRRSDPDWLGCNVTIPHKQQAARLVDVLDERAKAIGAVNCVVPRSSGLFGTNTDVDGIASALDGAPLEQARAAIIGAGGAARAAIAYLAGRNIREIVILVRDPQKAEPLRTIAPAIPIVIASLSSAEEVIEKSAVIINATQLGMTGCPQMPDSLIDSVVRHGREAILFDMVYNPIETPFLGAGRRARARVIDGLTMLVGQAARAFELFYGAQAPLPDGNLRDLLITGQSD
jgi:shikimate dehydrogenase